MTASTAPACIGEPVSWLALERAALGDRDGAVAAHLAACAACRDCLDRLRADVVALPPLRVEAVPPRVRWWRLGVAGLGAALAAAVLAIVLIPGDDPHHGRGDQVAVERVAHVKGVGEVVVGDVRDRAGAIAEDATTFRAGDRWKVVVTCAAPADAWLDVAVIEGAGDDGRADYPVAAAHVACGNRVVVPGAFELTGARPNRVCAVIAAGAPPPRARLRPADAACITVRPE
jgi:hypothetical protein